MVRGDRRCDLRSRRKRGSDIGVTKIGKGTKVEVVSDGNGLPIGVTIAGAHVPETALIEPTLESIVVEYAYPERLLYDKAADSDPLRERLAERGVELIAAHRKNRTKAKRQDGRAQRRLKRRWRVENLIHRLKIFRRLRVRYETQSMMFRAFVHLGCILILLKEFA